MDDEQRQETLFEHAGTKSPSIESVILIILLIAGAFLRLYNLDKNLTLDEIGQVLVTRDSWSDAILLSSSHAASTPLDYLITHFTKYIGHSAGIYRLPSVLWGLFSIWGIHKLGKRIFGPGTGLIAAFLLSILPLHVMYSQTVRFYSLATLLTIVSVYFFWRAVEKGTRNGWLLFGFVHLVALYAHYYILIITLVEGLWLLWLVYKKQLTLTTFISFCAVSAVSIILFLPWVYYDLVIFGNGLPDQFSTPRSFSLPELVNFLRYYFFSNLPFVFNSLLGESSYSGAPNLWKGAIWVLYFCGFLLGLLPRYRQSKSFSLVTLIPMLGIPAVLLLDYWAYAFGARQILLFSPFILLAAAAVINFAFQFILRKIPVDSLAAGVTYLIVGFGLILFSFYALKEPLQSSYWEGPRFRELSEWIYHSIEEGDILVIDDPRFIYYYAPELNPRVYPYWEREKWEISEISRIYAGLLTHNRRVWIIPTFGPFRQALQPWIDENQPIEVGSLMDLNTEVYLQSTRLERKDLIASVFNRSPMQPIQKLLRENQMDQAFEITMQMLSSNLVSESQKNLIRVYTGRAFTESGDHSRAIDILSQGISSDPFAEAESLANLGYTYNQQGDQESAIAAYRKAISLNPEHFWAMHLLAKTLFDRQEWDEIIKLEQRALEFAPNDDIRIDSLATLTEAFIQSGAIERACKTMSEILALKEIQDYRDKTLSLGCNNS